MSRSTTARLTWNQSIGTTLTGLRLLSGQLCCADGTSTSLKEASSIGDSEDALGRMLAVLRFWFTKDLVDHIRDLEKAGANTNCLEIRQGEAMQAL